MYQVLLNKSDGNRRKIQPNIYEKILITIKNTKGMIDT